MSQTPGVRVPPLRPISKDDMTKLQRMVAEAKLRGDMIMLLNLPGSLAVEQNRMGHSTAVTFTCTEEQLRRFPVPSSTSLYTTTTDYKRTVLAQCDSWYLLLHGFFVTSWRHFDVTQTRRVEVTASVDQYEILNLT